MTIDSFHANGIDGDSGEYLLPALTAADLARVARGEPIDDLKRDLVARNAALSAHYGLPDETDPDDLGDTGWGIVFAADADPAIREALAPLIALRQQAASSKDERRFRVFEGAQGYRPEQSKNDFLLANGGVPGECDPDRVPYYLLVVGSPEAIPFSFQYQLDVDHAVGRLHFDAVEDYARYAAAAVAAEQVRGGRAKRLSLFGPRNPDDDATALSSDVLLGDLAKPGPRGPPPGWALDATSGEAATKAAFARLLAAPEPPAVLFTASHGMGFRSGNARQARHQGALLLADWPGPVEHSGPIPPEMYFSADDLTADTRVAGLIAFCFACYGAGTPALDEFSRLKGDQIRRIAPQPFVAPLARAMTAHPGGPALAFIGHVERAWGYSFYWPEAGGATKAFQTALRRLMLGRRVGFALEPLNDKHASLSTDLTTLLQRIDQGYKADETELARLWTANNDARNYVIIGDPAVRAAVAPA
jgi:hypothetical protein